MLTAVLVVAAVSWATVGGRSFGSMEVSVTELQRLEAVLDNAALKENSLPLKRVVRERALHPEEKPGAASLEAAGALTNHLEEEKKRVTRGEPTSEQGDRGTGKTKISESREGRFLHSGAPTASYPPPHVTFNVPASHVSYSVPQQGPIPLTPPPVSHCGSGGCGGGTTIHVHDTHLVTQHVPQSYTATVPFISGYRLTPVVGHKQITLNDWYHGGSSAGAGLGGGCAPEQWGGYWQHLYNHGRTANSWTAEDLLKPFENARFFQSPVDQEQNLLDHSDYATTIDDLKHHIEHLVSLRDNAPSVIDPITV